MTDTSKVAKNLQAFRMGVFAHDRENPDHHAYGIGLAQFDMDRLGFDEGETLWDGITIHCDGKTSGNFRVLCDGTHGGADEQTTTSAIAREQVPG